MRNFTLLKSLLTIAIVSILGFGANAQTTVTYTFSEHYENAQEIAEADFDTNIHFTPEQGDAGIAKYYENGTAARFYQAKEPTQTGGGFTLAPKNGAIITKIVIIGGKQTGDLAYNVDGGADTPLTATDKKYTVEGLTASQSVKFRTTGNDKNKDRLYAVGIEVTYTINGTNPIITASPTSVMLEAMKDKTATADITVTGKNLTADINATISGVDASHFTVTPSTIAQTSGSADGVIKVTFKPTTLGNKEATLTLTSGTEKKEIVLHGTVIDPENPYGLDLSAPLKELNETFGDGTATTIPDGWKSIAETGDRNWVVKSFKGNNYMHMTAYNGKGVYKTLLITPAINFDGIEKDSVKFDWDSGHANGAILKVYVMEQNGTKTEVKSINDNTNTSGYGAKFTTEVLDLSNFSGIKFLVFEYNGNAATATTNYQIDNVIIKEKSGSGVANYKENRLSVWASGKTIFFNAKAGESVTIYNISGQKLQSLTTTDGINSIPVSQHGVMIIKVGNSVGKVVL